MIDLELVITSGGPLGKSFSIPTGTFKVGSAEDCEVRLLAGDVEARHAEITTDIDGTVWIQNLSSAGTTLVDGRPQLRAKLPPGVFFRLGSIELVLRLKSEDSGPHGTAQRLSDGASTNVLSSKAPTRPDEPTTQLVPGAVIANRYRVVERLAAGGMGEVYKAEHVELGKPFALKTMRPEFSNAPDFVERFKREAVASARIGHPNIIDITDFGRTDDGRFFFVMEYLDGQTITKLLTSTGALPVVRLATLGIQMCDALAAAHRLDIVHRDLKPDNIIVLQRPGQPDLVKVLDFGIAKMPSTSSVGQTQLGMVVGTPQYMAPEQASGQRVDARSDIYALGLIFYEMLCGRPVFRGSNPAMLISQHLRDAPPPMVPGPLQPVPLPLEEIIFRMLAKRPEQRPQTMAEVRHALSQVLAQPATRPMRAATVPVQVPSGPSTQQLVATFQPQRSATRWVLPVLGLVLAVGAVAAVMRQRQAPLPPVAVEAPPAAPSVVVAPPAPPAPEPAPVEVVSPAATPPPAPAEISLQLTSTPPRASVYAGGELLGKTPLVLKRPKGSTLSLRVVADGHAAEQTTADFNAAGEVHVTLRAKAKTKSTPSVDLKDID